MFFIWSQLLVKMDINHRKCDECPNYEHKSKMCSWCKRMCMYCATCDERIGAYGCGCSNTIDMWRVQL